MINVEFYLFRDTAKLPQKAHYDDACWDLYSAIDVSIPPGRTMLVRTGLNVALPEDYELQIRPRSGLALKHGITVLNSPGTLDYGYCGEGPDFEIGVILHNTSAETFNVKVGDRVAQMAIQKLSSVQVVKSDTPFDRTTSRVGGFGSSGT